MYFNAVSGKHNTIPEGHIGKCLQFKRNKVQASCSNAISSSAIRQRAGTEVSKSCSKAASSACPGCHWTLRRTTCTHISWFFNPRQDMDRKYCEEFLGFVLISDSDKHTHSF